MNQTIKRHQTKILSYFIFGGSSRLLQDAILGCSIEVPAYQFLDYSHLEELQSSVQVWKNQKELKIQTTNPYFKVENWSKK